MKAERKRGIIITAVLFALFIAFTAAVKLVDVQAIGPNGSVVGFAKLNGAVHMAIGEHFEWDKITDVLSLFAFALAACFAGLGVWQLVKSRSLRGVDRSIICLGVVYVLAVVLYVLFEKVVINYRPVIMPDELELAASYPSSHTMIVCCILGTAFYQFKRILPSAALARIASIVAAIILVLSVAGRLIAGVHWLTDIIGGLLIAAALISLYYTLAGGEDDDDDDDAREPEPREPRRVEHRSESSASGHSAGGYSPRH